MTLQQSLALVAAATVAACSHPVAQPVRAPAPVVAPSPLPPELVPFTTASAVIHDLASRQVGTVTFTDTHSGLLIVGDVSSIGLGVHGIHLHSVGRCEVPFASAGGHFNPTGKAHGFKNAHGAHLGDLPNISTPPAGRLHFEYLVPGLTLEGSHGLLDADGASIVIHAEGDDYMTDPAGDSGGRIACGVIRAR
jgi:Cu-Zn family superoxide dismutase